LSSGITDVARTSEQQVHLSLCSNQIEASRYTSRHSSASHLPRHRLHACRHPCPSLARSTSQQLTVDRACFRTWALSVRRSSRQLDSSLVKLDSISQQTMLASTPSASLRDDRYLKQLQSRLRLQHLDSRSQVWPQHVAWVFVDAQPWAMPVEPHKRGCTRSVWNMLCRYARSSRPSMAYPRGQASHVASFLVLELVHDRHGASFSSVCITHRTAAHAHGRRAQSKRREADRPYVQSLQRRIVVLRSSHSSVLIRCNSLSYRSLPRTDIAPRLPQLQGPSTKAYENAHIHSQHSLQRVCSCVLASAVASASAPASPMLLPCHDT
jgi:hypothetical protein